MGCKVYVVECKAAGKWGPYQDVAGRAYASPRRERARAYMAEVLFQLQSISEHWTADKLRVRKYTPEH